MDKVSSLTLSVVMANYNHSKFLPRAIQSILSQSLMPDEFIIIDDCSTDDSVGVIENIIKDHPMIKFSRNETNLGANKSFNRGMSLAKGRFVYLATSDDVAYDDLLEESMSLLLKYPHAGLSSAIVKIAEPDGSCVLRMPLINPRRAASYLTPIECLRLLRKYGSWMGYSSRVFRRDAALEFGGLLPELSGFADVFLETLLVLKYGACFMPKEMAVYTIMPGSFTSKFRSDLGGELAYYAHATHIMRTKYADIVPADYVNSWEKRITYRAKLRSAREMIDLQTGIMNDIIYHKNFLDRFVFSCTKLGIYLQFAGLVAYLYIRAGSDMRRELRRSALLKIKIFKERLNHAI